MNENMKEKYLTWIKNNVSESYGKCKEITELMTITFPELKRVRGHYHCHIWGEREHWWLVSSKGIIIDPTVSQFPSGSSGKYIEWIEGVEEPTGKCINCGEYAYKNSSCCSDKCYDIMVKEFNN